MVHLNFTFSPMNDRLLHNTVLILGLSMALLACGKKKQADTLFTRLEDTGIQFNNIVIDDSLENSFYYRNYYNGGGAGIGDINNDGLAVCYPHQ